MCIRTLPGNRTISAVGETFVCSSKVFFIHRARRSKHGGMAATRERSSTLMIDPRSNGLIGRADNLEYDLARFAVLGTQSQGIDAALDGIHAPVTVVLDFEKNHALVCEETYS